MRGNGIEHGVSSGGAGALTLSTVSGKPGFTEVFGNVGTRYVDYTVEEANLLEGGIGSLALATGVLTRTKVLYTWDGFDYVPSPGTATAPSALSFTTAAKVRCTPSVGGALAPPPPFRATALSGLTGGMGFYGAPGNVSASMPTGTIVFSLLYWPWNEPISQAGARSSANPTSPTYFAIGVYEVGISGLPANALALFDSWGTSPLATTAAVFSNALSEPITLPPGWYWQGVLATFASGTCTIDGMAAAQTYPQGMIGFAYGTGTRGYQQFTQSGQTALPTTYGSTPAAANTSSLNPVLAAFK